MWVTIIMIGQVSQNRLTWPGLLEHPFVRETSEELAARVHFLQTCLDVRIYVGIELNAMSLYHVSSCGFGREFVLHFNC